MKKNSQMSDAPVRSACREAASKRFNSLSEIEAAIDALPVKQKEELFFFIAMRLRAGGSKLPLPRKFSRAEMDKWIGEDEEDMRRIACRGVRRDPIVQEARKHRMEHTRKFGGDLNAIVADLQRKQKESGRTYVRLTPRRITKPITTPTTEK